MFVFIRSLPAVLDRILKHIEIPAFVDIIFRLIQLEGPGPGGVIEVIAPHTYRPRSSLTSPRSNSRQWLYHEGLIPKLASMLSPSNPPDLHAVVSDLLKGIIALCAPSPGNADDQMALVANRFSRQLASQEIADVLVGYMLDDVSVPAAEAVKHNKAPAPKALRPTSPAGYDSLSIDSAKSSEDTDEHDDGMSISSSSSSSSSRSEYHSIISSPSERSTSSLLHVASVIIELMRKNNSDFFEPYLFHTLRQRLIQIQQQYLPQLERPEMDAERRAENDRLILSTLR